MKSYDQPRVKHAEIVQLILLESLYTLRESREVIFQGGTAIRWFYGGMRFSEDLDFVTSLSRERVVALMKSAVEPIRRQMVANFGAGTFTLKEKKGHFSSYRAFIQFQPAAVRSKISVKIEFEMLVPGVKPNTELKIMQASPTVSHFLQEGGFKTSGASVIVNVETAQEILSDNDYDELILAVQNACRKVEAKGIIDFSLYPERKGARD